MRTLFCFTVFGKASKRCCLAQPSGCNIVSFASFGPSDRAAAQKFIEANWPVEESASILQQVDMGAQFLLSW